MRIVKSLQQGLLTTPFTLNQQHRLGVATLLAFELGPTHSLLTEQQMWQPLLPAFASGDLVLDMALPKAQGEWLLSGAAYSTEGRAQVRVAAAVAEVEKQLDIYGARVWLESDRASEPLPFTRQALDWQAAFGGPEVAGNRVGAGQQQPAAIFYPRQVQLEHHQQVRPAGFLPLPLDHPLRLPYQGTYGTQWLEQHWPGFPPDIDWRYFNVAPSDQRLTRFFRGGDSYYLVNLHPEQTHISGQLPCDRPRAFVYYQDGTFSELTLQCDTVWLFPDQLMGIMIYHGVAPISDDEALDVAQLILGVEAADSELLSLAHYQAQTERDLVNVDLNPPELVHAEAQFAKAEKTITDIPKLLRFKLDQIAGHIPVPQAGLLEQQAMMGPQLDRHLNTLLEMKTWLTTQPVSSEIIQSVVQAHQQLLATQQKLATLPDQLAALQQRLTTVTRQLNSELSPSFSLPELTADHPLLTTQALTEVASSWSAQAGRLISLAQPGLMCPACQQQLTALGLRSLTQQRAFIGYLEHPVPFVPEKWQLEHCAEHPQQIGPGWLLPEFYDGQFTALTLRPGALDQEEGAYRVPGSQMGFWYSALDPMRVKVLVPEWVLAWRLGQDVDDIVDVIVVPTPHSALAPEVEQALQTAGQILVPIAADASISPWQERFAQAEALFLGGYPTLTARLDAQDDQHQWLLTHLQICVLPLPEPSAQTFLEVTTQRVLNKITLDTGCADPLAVKANFMQQATALRDQLLALPIPPSMQEVLSSAFSNIRLEPALDPMTQIKAANGALQQALNELTELTERYPAFNEPSKIIPFQQQMRDLAVQTERLMGEAMAKLPQTTDAALQEYRLLTRAEVISAYQSGQSLVRVNIAGIDLSGLELSGIDLSESIMNETTFAHSDLSGALLNGVVANQACFKAARLVGAALKGALLAQADLSSIQAESCAMDEALLVQACLEHADLRNARLSEVMAEGVNLQCACLAQADLTDALLIGANLADADLTGANLERAILGQATLKHACLARAHGHKTHFWGINAAQADFSKAQLPNARFGPAILTGAQLQNAQLPHSNFMGSQAQGANFTQANLREAYINQADWTRALLVDVDLKFAQITRSNLEQAQLTGADLMRSNVKKTRLVAADCQKTNFFNSNLNQLVIGETRWHGANVQQTVLSRYKEQLGEPH